MKTTLQKPHQHTQPNQRFRISKSIGIGVFTFVFTVVLPFVGQAQNANTTTLPGDVEVMGEMKVKTLEDVSMTNQEKRYVTVDKFGRMYPGEKIRPIPGANSASGQGANPPGILNVSWSLSGNSNVGSSDFIGTNNSENLRFYTNNSQKMVLTTDGKLGLGIAAPVKALHVKTVHQDPNATPDNSEHSHYGIRLEDRLNSDIGNLVKTAVWDIEPKTTTPNSSLWFGVHDVFTTMALTEDGKVGIGTTEPQYTLDVAGDANVSGQLTANTLNVQNLDVPGRIKVGTNSLYLGTSATGAAGTNNYIKTTTGALRINGTETGITGSIQNTLINPDGGNVGIGTGTTAPSHNLHIKGIAPALRIEDTTPLTGTTEPTNFKILAHNGAARLISDQSFLIFINGDNNENNRLFAVVDNGTSLGGNSKNLFMIEEGGSVSIGTSSPTARLDINGSTGDGDQDIKIRATNGTINSELRMMAVVSSGIAESQIQFNGKLRFTEPVGGNVRLTISDNGDVDVCGRLLATEVEVVTGWCDYVFAEEYPLMPLAAVEKYINENKHLPGIPKASIVETEGLKVGEMSKAMMEKIEELHLYIIEMNKRIRVLEQENIKLKQK